MKKGSAVDKLNIYLIGMDSTSRLNFNRFMPNLETLWEDKFDPARILGFTKVGLNTFPNVLSLLTGLSVDKMTQRLRTEPFDRFPLI